MSPGLRPRPSLSAKGTDASEIWAEVVSPGLRPRPSLSELSMYQPDREALGVAGVTAPAFVERRPTRCGVSGRLSGVAGVTAPAFVERSRASTGTATDGRCRRGYGPGLR